MRTTRPTPCSPWPAGRRSPGLVVAFGAPDADGVPLLADRPLVRGRSAAYVCRGFVCDQPVTEIDRLAEVLAGRQP